MQDNKLQLIKEVRQKMTDALETYYQLNGHDQEKAEKANSDFQKYRNEYNELTGEGYDYE